jgi:hypothetical protein
MMESDVCHATRILKQSGKFSKVENLSGAWKTFLLAQNRV